MKKSLILLFTFIFVFIFISFNTKADSNEPTVETYYKNLDYNYSKNPNNSCSFVATTMLLSYYDTYLNDDIIPEQYDVTAQYDTTIGSYTSSPGVYHETITAADDSVYPFKLIEMKDYSLQVLLFYIADKLGYELDAINMAEREQVLIYYFNNYTPFIYGEDYEFSYIEEGEETEPIILEQIYNKIDLGEPIIISYDASYRHEYSYEISHVAIAYKYSGNNVFVHLGDDRQEANFTNFNLNTYEIKNIKEFFHITFEINHKHSNNIVIDDNDYNHAAYCPCGYHINELHNIIVDQNGIPSCNSCRKVVSHQEDFNIVLDPSNNSLCGTYVNLYGGNLSMTDIVVGYTRISYIQNTNIYSRLDYNWSSSNPNVCEVTKYGTILAKNSGQAYIIASNKIEPYKYSIICVNVSNDYSNIENNILITTDCRIPNSLNGTEVRINNGNPNEFTIHSGYTRALSFNSSNVYPSIDNFFWYTNSEDINILPGGYVEAQNVDEETEVIVNGFCIYNSNIKVAITFTILP